MAKYHRTCSQCGANLDPGEKCNCTGVHTTTDEKEPQPVRYITITTNCGITKTLPFRAKK